MDQTILIIIITSVLILAIGLLIYILYENKHFHVTTYEYSNKKLPQSFDQTVILFLSDLHNYSYGVNNEKLIKQIRMHKPDYVLIGGDMIVKGINFSKKEALKLIKRISKEYPVYYAFGNHELRISTLPETCDSTYVEYIDSLKNCGVEFLVDQKITLRKGGQAIDLYGLNLPEDYYIKFKKITLPSEELNNRLGTPDKERFNLLLAHNPVFFPSYANWGADLVLSGHVHGGMIALPLIGGVMSTQGLLFPKYDFGRYENKQSTMIISRGLGNHTIHVRINNHAELIKIVLRSNS